MDQTRRSRAAEIRSEAHGPHWVAWAVQPREDKPVRRILLVGQTREEAEERARQWAESASIEPTA